uniref:Secreted protein n=1 Tax=Oryza rufipogon TaxID=4529 RepID=A0A0E0R9D6_ORYRU
MQMRMRSVSTCMVSRLTWPAAAASAAWAERTNASRAEKNSRSWSRRTWTARLTAPVERHRDERRLVDAASFAGTKCRTRWRRSSGRSEIRSTAAPAAIVGLILN